VLTEPDGRKARGQETRHKLMSAAVRVAGRDGPGAVTHRAVAAEAGVTKSLATYHFATIDDLLTAALIECTDAYARQIAEELPPDASPGTLGEHLAANLNEHRQDWLAYYELFLLAVRKPALRAAARQWTEWTTEIARRYTDDPVAIDAFIAALDGIGMAALLCDGPVDPKRLARLFTLLLNGNR
jgi:DNA-binding transcriptional regulator YbjK